MDGGIGEEPRVMDIDGEEGGGEQEGEQKAEGDGSRHHGDELSQK